MLVPAVTTMTTTMMLAASTRLENDFVHLLIVETLKRTPSGLKLWWLERSGERGMLSLRAGRRPP